jgi:hypothetical protein
VDTYEEVAPGLTIRISSPTPIAMNLQVTFNTRNNSQGLNCRGMGETLACFL